VVVAPVDEFSASTGFELDTDEPLLLTLGIDVARLAAPTDFTGEEKLTRTGTDIHPEIEQRAIGYRGIGAKLDAADG